MEKIPIILQTKQDYLNALEQVKAGEMAPDPLIAAFENLLATRQAKFIKEIAIGKVPDFQIENRQEAQLSLGNKDLTAIIHNLINVLIVRGVISMSDLDPTVSDQMAAIAEVKTNSGSIENISTIQSEETESLVDKDYELKDNPYSEMARLGFTVEEIETMKNNLQMAG